MASAALLSMLEASRTGCLLLDRSGHVLRFNGSAERCLSQRNEIEHRCDDFEWATMALRRALGRVTVRAGKVGRLRLDDGRSLIVCRIELAEAISSGAAAALVIIDLGEHLHLPPELVSTVFGLTRAEAALAVLLASGMSLEEAAHRREIALATAHSHLKAALFKTSTHRQAELVALLTRLSVLPSVLTTATERADEERAWPGECGWEKKRSCSLLPLPAGRRRRGA